MTMPDTLIPPPETTTGTPPGKTAGTTTTEAPAPAAERIRWTMRFEAFDGPDRLRYFEIDHYWRQTLALDHLRDEALAEGLTATIVDDSPVPAAVFSRSPSQTSVRS